MISLAAFWIVCIALYFVGNFKVNHPKSTYDYCEGWILIGGVAAAAIAQVMMHPWI